MSLFATLLNHLQAHCSATPVLIGSPGGMLGGRRSMRVAGRVAVAVLFHPTLLATPLRLASALAQRFAASTALRVAQAASRHLRPFSAVRVSRFVLQSHTVKTAPSSTAWANLALNLVRFALWTLRDKTAQRRLALRSAP
jgi:hypothetical protein